MKKLTTSILTVALLLWALLCVGIFTAGATNTANDAVTGGEGCGDPNSTSTHVFSDTAHDGSLQCSVCGKSERHYTRLGAEQSFIDPGNTPLEKMQLLTDGEYEAAYEKYEDDFNQKMIFATPSIPPPFAVTALPLPSRVAF